MPTRPSADRVWFEVAAGLAVCGTAGLVSLTLDFFGAPPGLGRLASLLATAGANLAYLSGVFLVAWAALRSLAAFAGLSTIGVTLVAAVFFAGYSMAAGKLGASDTPHPFLAPSRTIPLMLLALAAGMLAGFWGEAQERRRDFVGPARACLRAFVWTLAAAALAWLLVYRTRAAVGWVGLAALAGCAALVALAARLSRRTGSRGSALGLAGVQAALVVAGGAGYWTEVRYAPEVVLGGVAGDDGRPPAVILLTVDTLRADMVTGPTGSRPPTPAVDSLAADSVVFERAISAGPWTLPGFASMLTGLSPLAHGLGREGRYFLPGGPPTIAELLAAEGYAPVALGSNPWVRSSGVADRFRWDFWHPRYGVGWSPGAKALEAYAPLYNGQPSTPELVDAALAFLRRDHGAPFFLWLHIFDPHAPYTPPVEYLDLDAMDERIGPELDGDETEAFAFRSALDPQGRRWVRELYEGEVRHVDDQLGRILEALRASGLYDEALIVFSSDHGEELFEHNGFEHGHTLYPELLRVPLMFKLPEVSRKSAVESFAGTVAVAPTILDLLGAGYDPAQFSSRSLRPLWESPGAAEPEPVASAGVHYRDDWVGVVFDRYQYLERRFAGRSELYDLVADPGAQQPLEDRPKVVERARTILAEREAAAAKLRRRLELDEAGEKKLDEGARERLRSLGYIQ